MRAEDIEYWRSADAAFDRLLDMPVSDRAAALAAMDLAPAVRARVQRLLTADVGGEELAAAVVGAHGPLAGRRLGRWMIEHEIGRGGMAVVYRAHAADAPDRTAALKLLTLGALAGAGRQRFEREQAILARLNHPHIATLLDSGIADDGTPWIAMVLVDGERIDHWCTARGLDTRARVRLCLNVCAAVAHAHRNLVVHRDLKPSNVLVDGEGHVRLLDFGIARLVDDTQQERTATHWRALSPQYAAPEQFAGAAQSTAIDVFGLGALLYAVLSGCPPRPDGQSQVIIAPSKVPPGAARGALPPALLRGDLDAIVLQALAEDPAARYASVEALAADLQRFLDGQPILARRAPLSERVRRTLRRHGLPITLATVAVTALVGGAAVALDRAREAQAQAQAAAASRTVALDSLARANALRDYLLGIFETQAPGRPRNELPSTAQLLDEGERLALDSAIGDPIARADMLDAITQVRLARGDAQRASRLIERSLQLSEAMPTGAASVKARALLRRAGAQRIERQFDPAMRSLREAQALAAQSGADALGEEIQLELANALLEQRRYDDAIAVLRPLDRLAQTHPDFAPRLREGIQSALGVALGGSGQHRESQRYRELALATKRERYGDRHFLVAVALANASGGNRTIGAFDTAEQQAREAIAIYDSVFDAPSEYRGSARLAIGWVELARGRYARAIAAFDAGNTEFAQARGIAVASDYPFFHWSRGLALAQSGEREAAVTALTRAENGLSRNPAAYALPAAKASAWLAIVHCDAGDTRAATGALARMRQWAAAAASVAADDTALFGEADARCALAACDLAAAQARLMPIIASDRKLDRGLAADATRRLLLAAHLARAQGDSAAAVQYAQQGLQQLRDAGLDSHPLHARVRSMAAGARDTAPHAACGHGE